MTEIWNSRLVVGGLNWEWTIWHSHDLCISRQWMVTLIKNGCTYINHASIQYNLWDRVQCIRCQLYLYILRHWIGAHQIPNCIRCWLCVYISWTLIFHMLFFSYKAYIWFMTFTVVCVICWASSVDITVVCKLNFDITFPRVALLNTQVWYGCQGTSN